MAHRLNRPLVLVTWLVFALCLLCAQPVGAARLSPDQTGPVDPVEIEAFIDDFWVKSMRPLDIPGMVFVLVRDGTILFAKGYGLADIEQGKPVDPSETLFAIGSVSKAVTASAVMQLVERGQLRLDEPVDSYLRSMQVGERCPQAVTTAHLLTHTAGFDERVIGAFVTSADELIPLADYVARDLPPCIRPPGEEMSYCNHCYGLAGLLVEEISNRPFEQAVQEHLFQPLEMHHSSFRQPLPGELDALRSMGYIFVPEIQPAPPTYANFFPSGGMWACGEDMGRFIIAHLQGGLPRSEPVFSQETLERMHQRQFSQDPRLEGWTYGFFEHIENGQRMIGKDGDVPGFSSSLYLMPEHNLGFFFSYNATVSARPGLVDPRLLFPTLFLDHYYPADETLRPANPSEDASRLAGLYRWSRFSHTSIDKAISPMSILQWRISANLDGSITLTYPSLLGGQTSRWLHVEPGLFQNQANGSYLAFAEDRRSRITHIYTKITEEGVLERVAWYETWMFQALLLVLMVVVFTTVLLSCLVGVVRRGSSARRASQSAHSSGDRGSCLATWLSGLLSGLSLLFLAGLVLTVLQSMAVRAPQLPASMLGLLAIPLLAVPLTGAMLACALLAWKNGYGSLLGRVRDSLLVLAGLVFIWFAWYWNLLGFKL